MLKLETILKDSLWVAKMQGWRECGTYDEIGYLSEQEDCRDFDLCCEQPEHLREFYDAYFKHDGFITVQDFYHTVYAPKPSRVWTEAEIKELLKTNDTFLKRALKKLYDCQTYGEQAAGVTSEANGVGFNKCDAEILTNICEFMLRRGYLSQKQTELVRRKILKYSKQLTRIANAA